MGCIKVFKCLFIGVKKDFKLVWKYVVFGNIEVVFVIEFI